MLCVYAGRQCAGFILNRFRDGFQAYDIDGKPIGDVYPTQREAAEAVRAIAGGSAR